MNNSAGEMPNTMPTHGETKQVLSEAEFIETVKEEKIKLVRRIMIFIGLSAVWSCLMVGIFYPVLEKTGDNAT